jgi:hypothetical protein
VGAPRQLAVALALGALTAYAGSLPADSAGARSGGRSQAVGTPTAQRAAAVVSRAQRLLERGGSGRTHLTPVLLRLVRSFPQLSKAARERALGLLARPTSRRDPEGNGWRAREAPASPACTPNFCVHWVQRSADAPRLADANGAGDGDGVPDYVELIQLLAERSYEVENGRLGWREPESDRRRGGDSGKTDVYLADIGDVGLFGYAAPDAGQRSRQHRFPRSLHGYLVVDDDYSRRQFPGTRAIDNVAVTLAHEYNHVLHFGYDAFQDTWFSEATATWIEDQVFDRINDYLRYMKRWTRRVDTPLTARSIRFYGTAVFNHWLQRRYGAEIVRRAWSGARRVRPAGFSVGSYQRAIRRAGGSGFNLDFARFCRDVAEWRTARVFAEGRRYPDFRRNGRLGFRRPVVRRLNHTTLKLLALPAKRGRKLRVSARVPARTTVALALVGRIGGERRGRVVSRLVFRRRGGLLSVALRRPERFDRLTAVLVNADTRQRGFDPLRLDWIYTRNRVPFTVRARLLR